ncbi:MAG TPA: NlpC/P60 family protein [Gaiellaceae bacterium]|jgi:cell wall-associated NlpC family hydrolase|nr:NlpC/P60 family protein [Gaiellaceae bacterium]
MRALKRPALLSALATGAMLAVAPAVQADPSLGSKRAEAQRVLVQLQRLDANAQRAAGRYHQAIQRLHRLEQQLSVNRQALHVARGNLSRAQKTLEQRLVAIYTSQEAQATLAVILGARSLDDLVARIETVNSVSRQNTAIIRQVVSFRRQIVRRRAFLRHARVEQKRLVNESAAALRTANGQLAAERRLYSSVKSQIEELVAQQQAQQLAAARRAQAAARAQVAFQRLGTFGGAVGGPAPPSRFGNVVSIAMQYLGVPYVWGGASPSGFDCSGFVMYVYAQIGISLPHYTVAQWDYPGSVAVSRDQLEPGDLVFFDGLGHVGIYIGNGEFIHAPHTGTVVSIDSLSGWYAANFDGGRRITG